MSFYRINGTNGFIQLEDGVITVHRDDSESVGLDTYRLDITKDTYALGRLPRAENAFLSVMDKAPRKGEYLRHSPEKDPLSILIPRTLADEEVMGFMQAIWAVVATLKAEEVTLDPKSKASNAIAKEATLPPVPGKAPKVFAGRTMNTKDEKHARRHIEAVEAIELPESLEDEETVGDVAPVQSVEVYVAEPKEIHVDEDAIDIPAFDETHDDEESIEIIEESTVLPEPVLETPVVEEPVLNVIDENAIDFVEKEEKPTVVATILSTVKKLPPLPKREIQPVSEVTGSLPKVYGRQWFIDCLSPYVREYVVVDIETTGLDVIDDRIIEIAAIRYIDDIEVSRFSSFVRPYTPQLMAEYTFAEFEELAGVTGINYIEDPYITKLTGIDNHMLVDAPSADQIAPIFFDFVGNLPVIGHNFLEFDLKFLREFAAETKTRTSIGHDVIDTMKMAEILAKDAGSKALTNIGLFLGAPETVSHRALEDTIYTAYIYKEMKKLATPAEIEEFRVYNTDHLSHLTIVPNPDSLIDSDVFYGKNVVFTGSMKMYRGQAMQYVVDGGGKLTQGITKLTDYLVSADDNDTNDGLKLRKSFQHRQAGQSITLIQEKDFYTLINRPDYVEWKKQHGIIEDPALEQAISM